MSDARAIAAVTRTLQFLLTKGVALDSDLSDTTVTTQPLDKARDNTASANQLNLFLYQTMPSATWRNQDMPRQTKPGESAMPPLGLNLHYLLTAFGKDNDATQPFSHQLLGRAMSVLHDHPLLGFDEIKSAFPSSDLAMQFERIRLSLQPLPVEDIFKLWSGFQTQYRLSAAYEVAVVLIDSTRRARTPLPVLTRGKDDSGVSAQGNLVPPYPTIESIVPPRNQPSVVLGDQIEIHGHHLIGDKVAVLFRHALLDASIPVAPLKGATADHLTVVLPDAPTKWPPGFYGLSLEITNKPGTKDERIRTSNEASMALAPVILNSPIKVTLVKGEATVKLKCSPEVEPGQRVSLLIGEQEVLAEARPGQTGALTFIVRNATAGEFLVRVRVDGVDG
jgi:hypothetical protein